MLVNNLVQTLQSVDLDSGVLIGQQSDEAARRRYALRHIRVRDDTKIYQRFVSTSSPSSSHKNFKFNLTSQLQQLQEGSIRFIPRKISSGHIMKPLRVAKVCTKS
eukprot:scpid9915/ scgid29247/ 